MFANGKVYTVDQDNSWAEAVAVRGNEIVYVGDDSGAAAFVGAGREDTDSGSHSAMALGLVYEYKLGNGWDFGGVLEHLDVHNHTNTVTVLVAGYTFDNGIRLFGGPGYEFKDYPSKVVFVPSSPSLTIGQTYLVQPERVTLLERSLAVVNALRHCGLGARDVYRNESQPDE